MQKGCRGLARGSTVAKLLADYRGIRNIKNLGTLDIEEIVAWVDAHKAATGDWPNQKSGPVTGTDELWSTVDTALKAGNRDRKSVASGKRVDLGRRRIIK